MKEQVRQLLDEGVDPFAHSICGANCLHATAEEGGFAILVSLLKYARNKVKFALKSSNGNKSQIAPLIPNTAFKKAPTLKNPAAQKADLFVTNVKNSGDVHQPNQVEHSLGGRSRDEMLSELSSKPQEREPQISWLEKQTIYESKQFQDIINSLTLERIETPLILASRMVNYCKESKKSHYERIIRLLISHKANPLLTNYKGWNAFNYYRQPYLIVNFQIASPTL